MKFLVLADIHGDLSFLPEIEWILSDCDGIIIGGDITDFGGTQQAQKVIAGLSAFDKPLLAVPGNCDPPPVFEELQQANMNLHGHRIDLNGLHFVGAGGALSNPGGSGEEAFSRTLKQSVSGLEPGGRLILVTHQPAYGTRLDHREHGRHAGSREVRRFIEQYQPILAVSGHIHEAYGTDRIGPTILVNPGPFRQGRYGVATIGKGCVQVDIYPQTIIRRHDV